MRVNFKTNKKNFSNLKKPNKLKVYNKKSHSMPYSKFGAFDKIIKWFKTDLK